MNRSSSLGANGTHKNELAPWRSAIARAIHRNRAQPFCRFLQLATVRSDGTPANRTVVFRGFWDALPAQGNQLTFISDRRSEKILHLQQNINVEACWYFTKTREQFRISGQMTVITADSTMPAWVNVRAQTWQKISNSARQQFAWPQPKGYRLEGDSFDGPLPDEKAPLPSFCVLLLNPHTVDYLNLRGEPQDRVIYTQNQTAENDWLISSVNP